MDDSKSKGAGIMGPEAFAAWAPRMATCAKSAEYVAERMVWAIREGDLARFERACVEWPGAFFQRVSGGGDWAGSAGAPPCDLLPGKSGSFCYGAGLAWGAAGGLESDVGKESMARYAARSFEDGALGVRVSTLAFCSGAASAGGVRGEQFWIWFVKEGARGAPREDLSSAELSVWGRQWSAVAQEAGSLPAWRARLLSCAGREAAVGSQEESALILGHALAAGGRAQAGWLASAWRQAEGEFALRAAMILERSGRWIGGLRAQQLASEQWLRAKEPAMEALIDFAARCPEADALAGLDGQAPAWMAAGVEARILRGCRLAPAGGAKRM